MATFGVKFSALLATGRAANLPTVWSNVLVAFWLIVSYSDVDWSIYEYAKNLEFWLLTFTLVSSSCLYTAGCMLGDYRDARFDSIHRPNRPIPCGIISSRLVAIISVILFLAGISLGFLATHISLILAYDIAPSSLTSSIPTKILLLVFQPHQILFLSLLTTLIITYAIFHKKNKALALINMASCRTFLYLFAMMMPVIILPSVSLHTATPEMSLYWYNAPLLTVAIVVGLYTFSLSCVAATESNNRPFNPRTRLFIFMISLPAITAVGLNHTTMLTEGVSFIIIATITIYIAWLIYSFCILPHSKPAFVSNALAGFCLLDACIAATFSLTVALICLGLFGLALLLQKVTPAT